ncbi:MAG: primosomal protein DnaI [Bacilli bacterium]|nr:primosomal protein DnaI [Bacilli bacterium]
MKKITDIYKVDENSLIHAFQDACSDKEFKDYVYNLNIKEDILMKYTSSLEEAYNECKNCKKCKNIDNCLNKIRGYAYTPIFENNIITFSYDACDKLKKELKQNSYKDNVDLYEMPKEMASASFKEVYKDDKSRIPIIKYFKEFMDHYNDLEKPKGVYLTGSFGSGKTYLISCLFNEMAKKGIKSAAVYYPEFLVNLKGSFSRAKDSEDRSFEEKREYIKRIPLLLLDDIGAENTSNWSRDEVLGPILQYRMENHLPTFFTSNLTLDELEKSLSITSSGVDKVKARRIIERIKQLTVTLDLISKNRRS